MKTPPRTNFLQASLFACLLALGCSAARAQDSDKPMLLVASPALEGAYRQTTLVAVPIGGGHLGFILNRTTSIKLATLFPRHAPSAKFADPVRFGGPMRNDALFAVVRRNPGKQSLALFGGLFVTSDAAAIERILKRTPNDARYFSGFVAWMPRELDKEIADGLWYVAEPVADLVFRRDTSGMWQELVKRLADGQPQRGRRVIRTSWDPDRR